MNSLQYRPNDGCNKPYLDRLEVAGAYRSNMRQANSFMPQLYALKYTAQWCLQLPSKGSNANLQRN